jgi:type 1 glutamine amidotransferase
MKYTGKITIHAVMLAAVLLLVAGFLCSCGECCRLGKDISKPGEKLKVLVVTGGHAFERKPFFTLFEGYDDIEYVEAQLKDHSEIFEDISGWDYDVIVFFNMTQKISPKRRENFTKLTYKHGADFTVHIEDTQHPITRGLADFQVHDETYKKCSFETDNHLLLTTNHPDSDRELGWIRGYGRGKVCFIMVGHGPTVYANPTYRQLVARSIRWSAN